MLAPQSGVILLTVTVDKEGRPRKAGEGLGPVGPVQLVPDQLGPPGSHCIHGLLDVLRLARAEPPWMLVTTSLQTLGGAGGQPGPLRCHL